MKIIQLLCITALLWLTGCASTSTTSSSSIDSPTGLTTSSTSSGQTGDLKPISAAQAASRAVAQLKPPADLWERIRRGFAMPNLDNDMVRDRVQYYAARPDYMLRMTERSSKYLFYIVEELERRNMPSELALLPFVESAFNPQAVSSAKAAGMWQFMPATGKTYDLKQNMFRDDRRDVLASTKAALDYLQKLHDMFGDWQLALAAYNWGEGNVARAIAKNQSAGLGTSYSDLSMPMETRMYVPKLQALKDIVADPQKFNTVLPEIGNHPYFQKVDITRDIDVALAAKLAEVRLQDFKELNPSANRPVILAAGTPQILLPWDNAAIFRRNLKAYSDGQLASWTAWTTPTTMKASDAARRVGMDESEFRSINHIPPRMMIKVGSTLLVPRGERVENDVTEHVADNGQLALAPEPPPITLHRTTVKARRGDSVAALARRYGQSAASVAGWNHMSASGSLKAGQHVVVYLPVKARAARTWTAHAGQRSEVRTVARVHSHSAGKTAASAPPRASGVKAVARTHTAPTRRVAKSSPPHRVHQTLVASESR
ncbi:MAG: LysM peptidoglycan-binding domain-containing protein [Burkholderiaceae bacterium]|nr:MAG: LysM peptidoglycan-binding domain-containing protein [Burkholderiaceae bacterium]